MTDNEKLARSMIAHAKEMHGPQETCPFCAHLRSPCALQQYINTMEQEWGTSDQDQAGEARDVAQDTARDPQTRRT